MYFLLHFHVVHSYIKFRIYFLHCSFTSCALLRWHNAAIVETLFSRPVPVFPRWSLMYWTHSLCPFSAALKVEHWIPNNYGHGKLQRVHGGFVQNFDFEKNQNNLGEKGFFSNEPEDAHVCICLQNFFMKCIFLKAGSICWWRNFIFYKKNIFLK